MPEPLDLDAIRRMAEGPIRQLGPDLEARFMVQQLLAPGGGPAWDRAGAMRMTPYRKRLLVRGLGYGRPFAPSGPVNPCYTVGLVVEDGWAPDHWPPQPSQRPVVTGRWTHFRWWRIGGEDVFEWAAGELPAQPDGAYSVPSSPEEEG